MLLSIVIPAYNVEKYVVRCLESVYASNINESDFEVIVIDDGSTDSTASGINMFIQRNPHDNLIFMQQENQGLSATRNRGMDTARGEYIWFVDSDDWIEGKCLGDIANILRSRCCDIMVLTTSIHRFGNVEVVERRSLEGKSPVSGLDVFKKYFISPYSGVQFYIFNKQFLFDNNLRFVEGVIYEDLIFTPEALSCAHGCIIYDVPAYNYLIRENSITTKPITVKNIESALYIVNHYAYESKSVLAKDMTARLLRFINRSAKNIDEEAATTLISSRKQLKSLWKMMVSTCSIKNIAGYLMLMRTISRLGVCAKMKSF